MVNSNPFAARCAVGIQYSISFHSGSRNGTCSLLTRKYGSSRGDPAFPTASSRPRSCIDNTLKLTRAASDARIAGREIHSFPVATTSPELSDSENSRGGLAAFSVVLPNPAERSARKRYTLRSKDEKREQGRKIRIVCAGPSLPEAKTRN